MLGFTKLQPPNQKLFENIAGKEENAGNHHFLLFPECFLAYQNSIIFKSPI